MPIATRTRRAAGSRSFCSRRERCAPRACFAEVASAFRIPRRRGYSRRPRDGRRGQSDPRPPLQTPRGISQTRNVSRKTIGRDPRCRLYVAARPTLSARRWARASPRASGGRRRRRTKRRPAIVSCDVVADRVTGLGRGFAFVRMRDARLAARVVAALDGANVEGRDRRPGGGGQTKDKSRRPEARRDADAAGRRVRVGGYARRSTHTRDRASARSVRALRPPCGRRRRAAVAAATDAAAAAAAAEMAAPAADPAFATDVLGAASSRRRSRRAAASRPATAATAAPETSPRRRRRRLLQSAVTRFFPSKPSVNVSRPPFVVGFSGEQKKGASHRRHLRFGNQYV